jgi:hypothetical protein
MSSLSFEKLKMRLNGSWFLFGERIKLVRDASMFSPFRPSRDIRRW